MGSRLKGFHVDSCTQVLNAGVLNGCRIHGIAVHHFQDNESNILAVYGARQLALLQMCWQEAQQSVSIRQLAHASQLPHWVLQVEITACLYSDQVGNSDDQPAAIADASERGREDSCQVVLGLMDNSVELWRFAPPPSTSITKHSSCSYQRNQGTLWQGVCVARVECESRQLLYTLRVAVLPPVDPAQRQHHTVKVVVAAGIAILLCCGAMSERAGPTLLHTCRHSTRHYGAPCDTSCAALGLNITAISPHFPGIGVGL